MIFCEKESVKKVFVNSYLIVVGDNIIVNLLRIEKKFFKYINKDLVVFVISILKIMSKKVIESYFF